MFKKIAVLGAGAIGSSIGADLTDAGHDVLIIDQWPDNVEAMKRDGLRITMTDLDLSVRVNACHLHEVYGLQPQFDLVLLACKSYDSCWLAHFILPYLKSDGVLVSMQNSLNDEWLAPIIGTERMMGCVVELSGEMIAPARVMRNTTRTSTWLGPGELNGKVTSRLSAIEQLLRCSATTEKTTNLLGARWSKLIVNAMTQGPIGMLGIRSAQAAELEGFFDLATRIGEEAYQVAKCSNVRIEPVFGLSLSELNGSPKDVVLKLLNTLLLHLGKNSRNAVVQDHAKGRRTEVDFINGLIVRKGLLHQIPTPFNAAVNRLNKDIELGKLSATSENLKKVWEYIQ
jgi:2-dehydropantoate 2-reductase